MPPAKSKCCHARSSLASSPTPMYEAVSTLTDMKSCAAASSQAALRQLLSELALKDECHGVLWHVPLTEAAWAVSKGQLDIDTVPCAFARIYKLIQAALLR